MAAQDHRMDKDRWQANGKFLRGVLLKGLLLFLLINLVFVLVMPVAWLGRLSAYNFLFPGRPRLPFGERPDRAYNLSLLQLDAMFASHELAGTPKPADEYRVFLLGDSNTWGFLLDNNDTLAAALDNLLLTTPDGRRVRFYNLGYPTISLTKDLLVLDQAMRFEPDMLIWLVTLEAFPREKQLFTPLVQNNPEPVRRLIDIYQLEADRNDPAFVDQAAWERTIFGQRRTLADLIRFQVYGVLWAATGIDQDYPDTYTPVQSDLSDEVAYYGMQPPSLDPESLALDVMHAGFEMMGDRPVLLVNEPMYISQGANSDLRYNFYYPRWAYDQYRQLMLDESRLNGWNYLDVWDMISPARFTNSAIHLDAAGTIELAKILEVSILQVLDTITGNP